MSTSIGICSFLFLYESHTRFWFYFVVWHSLPSLKSQFEFLYRSTNKVQQILSYIAESIIYWMAAIMGLAGVYLWIDFSADYFLPLFYFSCSDNLPTFGYALDVKR